MKKLEAIIIAAVIMFIGFAVPTAIIGWSETFKIVFIQLLITALFALCLAAFYRDGD